jgi:integrase
VSEAGNEREGFVEPPDLKRLVAQLDPEVADVATFAYRSAWRRTEVLMLPWKDVSFERRQGQTFAIVKLPAHRTKNMKRRALTIGPNHPLHDVLRRRQAVRRLDCGLVFHRAGGPIRDFRKQWASACKAAGLTGTLFHDMRRSGVRNLVRAGVPQSVAMRVSGHRTQSVFQRYDIVSDGDLARALDAEAAYAAEQEEAGSKIAVLNENADTSRTLAPDGREAGVA